MMQEERKAFELAVRVYYEDTDAAGVVYYANYLRYMERGRTEWMRSLGMERGKIGLRGELGFVVRRAEISYQAPARIDDALIVRTSLLELRRAGMRLQQDVVFQESGAMAVSAIIELVCVDLQAFRPTGIPEELKAKLRLHS